LDLDTLEIDHFDTELLAQKTRKLILIGVSETNQLLDQICAIFFLNVQGFLELIAIDDPSSDKDFCYTWLHKNLLG
jgi:hypothetical protein